MNQWSLIFREFDPRSQGTREALCTVGNGYFCTRGAEPWVRAGNAHYPGTYLAGGYNRVQSEVHGEIVENEDLVNLPNWLYLTFRVGDGPWLDVAPDDLLSYRRDLDLRRGLLTTRLRWRDRLGRITRVEYRSFAHMSQPHLGAIRMRLTPENWSGQVQVRTELDGCVANQGVARYRALNSQHLRILQADVVEPDMALLRTETTQSRLEIAMAVRTRFEQHGHGISVHRLPIVDPAGRVGQLCTLQIEEGITLTVEKTLALYTSRDRSISEAGQEALEQVRRAPGFDSLQRTHSLAWLHLWRQFDIRLEARGAPTERDASMILRLHIFHLLQTVSPNTMELDVGVPARGWHGEAYRGHVFWDELFVFPLLNLRMPEITRALLRYRYRRIEQARQAARQAGYQGAMYPWQSGSNGREETQSLHLNPLSGEWKPDHTHLQRHVSADIAYNVWQYYQVTEDKEFLAFYGGEMILEIARFLASLTTYNAELERYEIVGVVGPDEYHDAYPDAPYPGLRNNAYTNVMTVWVLSRALDVLVMLPDLRREELRSRIDLMDQEIERWRDISRRMHICFHGDGVISQFEGYDTLKPFAWEDYRRRYGNIQRLDRILLAEGDSPNRYQVSKQADVLMLIFLFSHQELEQLFAQLGYALDEAMVQRNVEYYLEHTSHGSTLSRVVHSWVLAECHYPSAWKLFVEALHSDISDIQGGTTAEGIHLGAMAGTVDLVQRGFTGLELRDDILWFNPNVPAELDLLHLDLRYRAHALSITITPEKMTLMARDGKASAIRVGIYGEVVDISAGHTYCFACRKPGKAPPRPALNP